MEKARKWRKMLGGGMRQAGVIAAAGIIALQKMVNRLAEDHATARHLAYGLARIPGIGIQPEKIQTNIVFFEAPPSIPGPDFKQQMNTRGVKCGSYGGQKIRGVTHRMVSTADIDEALKRIDLFVRGLG